MDNRWVLDIEANGFNPDTIWCINCIHYSTGERRGFIGTDIDKEFPLWYKGKTLIGHNLIGYDVPVLNKLIEGVDIKLSQVVDTLVLSRLASVLREGGHSLDKWGKRLGFPKTDFHEFEFFSDEMVEYCWNDVELNLRVYSVLLRELKGFSAACIKVEHESAYMAQKQREHGVYMNREKCERLYMEVTSRRQTLEDELDEFLEPVKTLVFENYAPKRRLDGELPAAAVKRIAKYITEVNVDGTYNLYEMREVNLRSTKQKLELLTRYGWNPVVFNRPTDKMQAAGIKRGSPKLCPENYDTLPPTAPQALKNLSSIAMLKHRGDLVGAWLEDMDEDNRLHGSVITIGAATHRKAHIAPNTANIPSVQLDHNDEVIHGFNGGYGWECRDCFSVDNPVDKCIVGTDASGIQLRILAHYINDPEFTHHVCDGDIHTYNQGAAGLATRSQAKTFKDRRFEWKHSSNNSFNSGKLSQETILS